MRNSKKRLDKVGSRIEAMPITPAAENDAFERFRATGELPEHQTLAERTIERALHLPQHRPLRELLFHEAVHEWSVVRDAARLVLKLLVAVGQDVTSRNFLDEDMELPEYGSVGLHLLGFPECLVKPPYEDQARRLLGRLAFVRRRVPSGDERWFRSFAKMAARFFNHGELPDVGFERDVVLAYGEFLALGRNLWDEADPDVLAAFDKAARGEGEEREAAIGRLQELAVEGRVP